MQKSKDGKNILKNRIIIINRNNGYIEGELKATEEDKNYQIIRNEFDKALRELNKKTRRNGTKRFTEK